MMFLAAAESPERLYQPQSIEISALKIVARQAKCKGSPGESGWKLGLADETPNHRARLPAQKTGTLNNVNKASFHVIFRGRRDSR